MLIFTYGSMMKITELHQRCPTARTFCNALLPDHQLRFNRESKERKGGVASVVPHPGSEVWGVVYEIALTEMDALDRGEGFRPNRPPEQNSYRRLSRQMVLIDGDPQQELVVELYQANPQANPPLPSKEYLQLLIDGAAAARLPLYYQLELADIPTA